MAAMTEPRPPRPRITAAVAASGPRFVLAAILVGLATGALTQLGQGLLPEGWSALANALSPWLLVAFLVGSRSPGRGWALAGGAVTLLFALLGYYASVALRLGIVSSIHGALIFWGIGAVVGGPVFALAGHAWRGERPWLRAGAAGLVGAAAVAEGVYLVGILPSPGVGAAGIALGVAAPVVLGRSAADRWRGLGAIIPCTVLGFAGWAAAIALYGLLTG